jgi:hypothetical protein
MVPIVALSSPSDEQGEVRASRSRRGRLCDEALRNGGARRKDPHWLRHLFQQRGRPPIFVEGPSD